MRKKSALINSFVIGALFFCGNADCRQRGTFAQSVKRSRARVSAAASGVRRDVYPPRPKAQIEFASIGARARGYEPYMLRSAKRYGVDPRVLWAIAFMETRFRPGLVSEKGARGMMQFMPATAARFRLADPFNPVAAIEAAARYVRFLSQKFASQPALVLAAYNAGEGAVDSYLRGIPLRLKDGKVINPRGLRTGGVPPYAETERYVAGGLSVMRLVNDLEVFSATEIAACGASVALPRPPRSTAQRARASGGVALGSSPESGAERVVESAPEPVSIYARVMNQPVSARLPSPAPASEISISRTAVPVDDASEGAGLPDLPNSSYASRRIRR